MLSIPAFFALIGKNRARNQVSGRYRSSIDLFVFLWIISLTIIIGLRYEVGGDWINYALFFDFLQNKPLDEFFESTRDDPLYNLINLISSSFSWGVYGVNFICAAVFSYGLGVLCKKLPRPWLGFTIAVPYLVIVVAMGYTRQSLALGFVMLGLAALTDQKIRKFVIYIIFAALAHKTAILMLPIAGLAANKNRLSILLWMFFLAFVGYFIFLADAMEFLIYGYIELNYQSDGALIRILMNAVPAFFLLLFFNRFKFRSEEKRIWAWLGIISIGIFCIYFIFPSSSALDRAALYLLPIQIVVFSYLPNIFTKNNSVSVLFVCIIIFYSGMVQYVWLNYAVNSWAWLPYQTILS